MNTFIEIHTLFETISQELFRMPQAAIEGEQLRILIVAIHNVTSATGMTKISMKNSKCAMSK